MDLDVEEGILEMFFFLTNVPYGNGLACCLSNTTKTATFSPCYLLLRAILIDMPVNKLNIIVSVCKYKCYALIKKEILKKMFYYITEKFFFFI